MLSNAIRSRFTIKSRLFAFGGLMLAAIATMAAVGFGWTKTETDRSLQFIKQDFALVVALGSARSALANLRRYEKDALLNMAEEADLKKYQQQWRAQLGELNKSLDEVERASAGSLTAAISGIRKGIASYADGFNNIIKDIETGKLNDPWMANKAMDAFKPAVRAADTSFDQLAKQISGQTDAKRAVIEASAVRAAWWIGGTALVCLSIGILLSLWNVFAITQPLDELKRVASLIAEGDLTQQLSTGGRDELAALSKSMHTMQLWLHRVVSDVRLTSESVASSSSEIAQGNLDLSARTENQAANLQQTAASMEQLTATVNHNAATTKRASTLAAEASATAKSGGTRVGSVAATMTDIEKSSKKIADIIGVIDAIAFQTNILALNAAVEAARAGEQGRGFAVVASEVRLLAKRSADSATDIKSLIAESTRSVGQGAASVGAAEQAMQEIVTQVERVTSLLQELADSTTQQAAGIAQASHAVTTLDQMTQQNAALVEQSSAAAASLDQQAQRLTQTVGVFRLEAALTR
jgi:methyl-accepting chemotaxis protein